MVEGTIGRFNQTVWTAVFSYTEPHTTVACRRLCVEMLRFMQQRGFWLRLLKEQFGYDADGDGEAGRADPYEVYVLLASRRSLRRSRLFALPDQLLPNYRRGWHPTTEDKDAIMQETDTIVGESGARPGDIVDLNGFRIQYWSYVGRNTHNSDSSSNSNKYHLVWNTDESTAGYATIPFLFTKHFRNAMWMLYDVLVDKGSMLVGVYLACDDDFVVSLFGCALPDWTMLALYIEDGEVSSTARIASVDQNFSFIVQLKSTAIAAAEAVQYRSLGDCRRANYLAASDGTHAYLYELDLDDPTTATTARQLLDGSFTARPEPSEPVVVVEAKNMEIPTNNERFDDMVNRWHELYPDTFDKWGKCISTIATAEEADAFAHEIQDHWQEFAGTIQMSLAIAKSFSTFVRKAGQPAPACVEDFSFAQQPEFWLNAMETPVPREVTYDWKDYFP